MSDAGNGHWSNGIRCMWMRGGTSKGGCFLSTDLPVDQGLRDRLLLGVMGSPDPRQIDGMGGADPLTSKVAIVGHSDHEDADVDYLFLQVGVDKPLVSDVQNCGNLLAGVAPFAIERGLVKAQDGETNVRVFMCNTGKIAVARVQTPGGRIAYSGKSTIDGVPGTAAPVLLSFEDTAGSTCGALLPTGNVIDIIDGIDATLIDNGMPTVILRAKDMGIAGTESREQLDGDVDLRNRLETIRMKLGPMMNLGDVQQKTIPKMTMVSPATSGGAIASRTFIPHRCHASIGVLGAVSVATACVLPGSIANDLAIISGGEEKELRIEHPIGATSVVVTMDEAENVTSAAILRTARKLFDGTVFPATNWTN